MKSRATLLIAGAVIFLVSLADQCRALCMYDGKLYAKTTLVQEFRAASLVVTGEVLSSTIISIPDPDEDSGVLYRVKVDQSFKGKSQGIVTYYTRRDSGGFYLDKGMRLLFLDPIASTEWAQDAPGSMVVNYSCGQSRAWTEVSQNDRKQLGALTPGHTLAR